MANNRKQSMQFTKLFSSILDSTIWQESAETKIVWITMLAMVDRNGEVHASIPGLASRAKVTLSECECALVSFKSPDPYSRTKDNEGKRIEDIDGGWLLLNHSKYRALLSAEERREYNRRKQAECRAKQKPGVIDVSLTVNHNQQCQHITEAEAEAEAETKIRKKKEESLPLPFDSLQFKEAWSAWMEYRKEIKKTLKPTSIRALFAQFAKWGESDSIHSINESIKNGWQGVFEPKAKAAEPSFVPLFNGHRPPAGTPQPQSASQHTEFVPLFDGHRPPKP